MKSLFEMEQYLADTHSLIWYLTSDTRLSTEARRRFEISEKGEGIIFVSVMTIIEMIYLQEKGKIPKQLLELFKRSFIQETNASFQVVSLDYELALSLSNIPREAVPEMPDRIIAATACSLGIPLITKDERLHQWEGVVTIW
ncbi:MAG: type II toxin-antitoxin system VapC family toxin [Deltaproteobacteria bacterium]|nr:type II toxin-antitoxin system VapC family toxin [Deltaproteobacteria bacterium]